MFRKSVDLTSKRQTSAAPVLSTIKSRKLVDRFPCLTAPTNCGALQNMFVGHLMKPATNKVQAYPVKGLSRLPSNLPQRKTALKEFDDPVHVRYLKRKQPGSLVAS